LHIALARLDARRRQRSELGGNWSPASDRPGPGARDLRDLAGRLARHLSDGEKDLLDDAVRWLRQRPLILEAQAEKGRRLAELEGRLRRTGGALFR
jgi:hypothetical protein